MDLSQAEIEAFEGLNQSYIEIDHEEAIQFLDSSAGAPFRHLVSVDEDNRRLIGN